MFDRAVYNRFQQLKDAGDYGFAVLIDPDDLTAEDVVEIAQRCEKAQVDFVFLGGSLVISEHIEMCIQEFKKWSQIPLVLFPGNANQVVKGADALLYLSLVSGRNPDLLIGQHVVSAPAVKRSGLEVISTGYMLIDGGKPTTASYMSFTQPIPHNKPDIALCTAWAAELQGKHIIYMDAGSGALQPIDQKMIETVSKNIQIPLIVGGGIRTPELAVQACKAGAQVIVVGNAIEKDSSLIDAISTAIKGLKGS